MRLATFNLYNFAPPGTFYYDTNKFYTDTQFRNKSNWIKKTLADSNADVVGFQEVFGLTELKALCAEAGYDHFAHSETTEPDPATKIYARPVCALCSRTPIGPVTTLPFSDALAMPLQQMHLALNVRQHRGFSRLPVVVEVMTDEFGPVTVIVLHLKSKRPMTDDTHDDRTRAMVDRVRDTMLRRSRGMVASMLQRGAEAASVYAGISDMLAANRRRPIVVLGDINDNAGSVPLAALQKPDRFYTFNAPRKTPEVDQANRFRYSFQLHDAWDSAGMRGPRPVTHYFAGVGNVLDYVLVSNVFDAPQKNRSAIGYVHEQVVIDDHIRGSKPSITKSDHAVVVADLRRPVRPEPIPAPAPAGGGTLPTG